MAEVSKDIFPVSIEDEVKKSYLDYAMSVIVGRALPDVRDGLKPVHRRVLFAMHGLNNDWNKPHKKSARIVGDVIGKYHPHGDSAVYDTIVRMAQPFAMRSMLVDGQGNFGSVDGDAAAAMRYTEIRMSKYAHTLLEDLEKETVEFAPNYDETEFAPVVLPTRAPNLLVNGSSGIAVGMATNIPPHNLGEVVDSCIAMIDDPEVSLETIMEIMPGPDFPTAGIINGRAGILEAYRTGRGRIYVRAKVDVETNESNKKQAIIVTELPYQVNKARLIEKIADLVRNKKIEGITSLRDESDKDGMRIVIELRRGEISEVVINNLYSQTAMENVFGINMVALDNGQPRVMSLLPILAAFIDHRKEVVTRRTIFDLRKARARAHILEGLAVALANIDAIIAIIKAAKNPEEAKKGLLNTIWKAGNLDPLLEKAGADACRPEDLSSEYGLNDGLYRMSPIQAQAILDLRLHRLTGLEQDKIHGEFKQLLAAVAELLSILADRDHLMRIIREELIEIKTQFANERRSEIISSRMDLSYEDLIPEEDVVITLSNLGYVKYQPLTDYQAQHRGGKGRRAAGLKDEDSVLHMLTAKTHDTILCFSSKGKVYWLKVYQLSEAGNQSRGRPIVNLLPLESDETICAMLPIREYSEEIYVFMVTDQGTVKKVALSAFSNQRVGGIIALGLNDGDCLKSVAVTDGQQDIMLFSNGGKVTRFNEDKVRSSGRTSKGCRGIKLRDEEKVISLVIAHADGEILTVTENGFGKRTKTNEYRVSSRGGSGVISIQTTERNGSVIGAVQVVPEDEIIMISDRGTLVRMPANEISLIGRNTQGVSLMKTKDGEKVASLEKINELEIVESDDDNDEA